MQPARPSSPARHAGSAPRRRPRAVRAVVATALALAGAGVATAVALNASTHHRSPVAAPSASTASSPAARPSSSASPQPPLWHDTPAAASDPFVAAAGLDLTAPAPAPAALLRQLTPLLADPAFDDTTVSVVVADPGGRGTLVDQHGADVVAPASTAKLAVAVAALQVLGPDERLSTSTVLDGDRVVLVGGGDPTLAGPAAVGAADPGFPQPARLSDLATETASALRSRGLTTVRLGYDASLFSGPSLAPGWKPTYLTEGDVAPVSALEVDEGEPDLTKPPRAADPAAVAAADFAALLVADGVTITGAPVPVTAAPAAAPLAAVSSPDVAQLVQRMLGRSDNDLAEALARRVAIATKRPATFAGGATAVAAAVAAAGVPAAGLQMVDASGLSTADRARLDTLVQLVELVVRPGHPQFAPIARALPIAGFSGTLAGRYTQAPAAAAAGAVHAKTGTLDGTVALVGYLDDASGRLLAFGVVVSGVAHNATTSTERAVDRLTAGIAACGCG
jgi:D-alanyl-D-alanine carboxypeptidase/D-alanyl-D-alanine-endopeptidase (penicillin-binding protein 4)